ncbi:hypothetical protein AB395_00002510 [Sinorhizobium fredii CCBAU 45436]|nr:hypothetical protein SF83666_c25430 [Sinorhizobium fredii CCBAU 83666]AWI58161.1 hypothetical protein AB395_00002510 [Sinorhizobium fredii CCBAU 45436]
MLVKDIRHFNEFPGDFRVGPCSEKLPAHGDRPELGSPGQ